MTTEVRKEIFLGKLADDLSRFLSLQSEDLFNELGIQVPVKSTSILLCIFEQKKMSLAQIAETLQQSRQLILQKLPKLKKLGLVIKQEDESDKRKKIYELTSFGQDQAMKVLEAQSILSRIYEDVYAEINQNLYHGIEKLIKSLGAHDLTSRYKKLLLADQ